MVGEKFVGEQHYSSAVTLAGCAEVARFSAKAVPWSRCTAVDAPSVIDVDAAPITSWQTLPTLLTPRHLVVIAFLGVVSSGVGFFMWNSGLRRVHAGTLAVFNNAKIPLGVLVSVIVFEEMADPTRLAASLLLLGFGVWMAAPTTPAD